MSGTFAVFCILATGYLFGRINFFGIKLGASGVLLSALVFGHFGAEISPFVRELGLVLFVTSVGFIAGPVFFHNFRKKAWSYVTLGLTVIGSSVALCIAACQLLSLPVPLSLGLLTGSLTSTPGLAAAVEATGSDLASVGYGIAYPFGVVSIVLFVQLTPRLLHADMAEERRILGIPEAPDSTGAGRICIDPKGFFVFSLAAGAGLLLGRLSVPLPGGGQFALGSSGGPLILGLLLGHFGHAGRLSLSVSKSTLEIMRELGLALFLTGTGVSAGSGFVSVLEQYGAGLFLIGVVFKLIPLFLAYFVARRLLRFGLLDALGSLCGGMTSTPALGTLIAVSGSDVVAASYAATYPIALICMVLACQLIAAFVH